jgi:hypothetical protein
VILVETEDKRGWPAVLQAFNNVALSSNNEEQITASGKVLLFLDDHMELLAGFLGESTRPIIPLVSGMSL